jgi:two-component system, LuxR family, sensor kinase FixL
MPLSPSGAVSTAQRKAVLWSCVLLAGVVAACDSLVGPAGSIGRLYVGPVVIAAFFLRGWQIVACALVAAILEQFGAMSWGGGIAAWIRVPTSFIGFATAGLLAMEAVRQRRMQNAEAELRLGAEREAQMLVESSPAAIITVAFGGAIELTNEAARRLLGLRAESAGGQNISDHFPMLGDLLKSKRSASLVRTMVEGSGRRADGEMFFAQMWLSSYQTNSGPKLAVVVADVSEQLRDREELGLRQLLMNSKIIAGAVSHEIRNLAAAARLLHENIGKAKGSGENGDFEALGGLIGAMCRLAASETPASSEQALSGVDVNQLLKELRIILESRDASEPVAMTWEIAESLPRVRADRSGLLQIFLNLAQNSRRALAGLEGGCITVVAYQLGHSVVVRFSDNGPGIQAIETLFQPFQPSATAVGLGLYVSRAIIRTYGGELQYLRRASGACFLVEMPAMAALGVAING